MTGIYRRFADFFDRHERIVLVLQILIFIAYLWVRIATSLPALRSPRALADTDIYKRISTQPILGPDFLAVDRPFVFPFLLQVVDQDFRTAAGIQLGLTILAWGALAYFVSSSFRATWLRLFSFITILALSLVRHLAGWDFVMMTESLSLSSFALLIACGIWLLRGWRVDKVVILCVIAFLFAFTRDTNAYLLIMFTGMIILAVLLRWAPAKSLIVAAAFALTFLISNLSADVSERWVFPLVNVVGKRILPYTASIQSFESCGMPVTPQLLRLADTFANGQNKAFFNDPALVGFRLWVREDGKRCYMRWLAEEPVQSISQAMSQFNDLIYFGNAEDYFSRRYEDLLPSRLERLLYPVHWVIWIWVILTLAALAAVMQRAWRENPLWLVFIMLCLSIFPHLFITWHGDAMAPHRHAVSVGMQLAVSMWVLIFLLLEQADVRFTTREPRNG
jgi:hypothetical protein